MDPPSSSSGNDNNCNCIIEKLLLIPFGAYTHIEKQNIINEGRPTPTLQNLKSKCKNSFRYFNTSYYNSNKWLSGCQKTQKLYCWPCILFSQESNTWSKNGCNDLNNFHNLKHRHEINRSHIKSLITLKKFGSIKIEPCETYQENIKKHNETVKNNRYVISRFIDATCFLAKQELSFRGRNELITSTNRGNFVELIHLMGTLDPKLSVHLSNSTVISGDMQNDVIESISNILLETIKNEIERTDFVSLIMDETTDMSKSQLSTILRYMTNEGVEERFLGYVDISHDRSAHCLAEHVFRLLHEYKCKDKLVAQTYDGSVVMSAQHNVLQTLIRSKCENAIFVPCYAHKLNLILKHVNYFS